VNLTEPVMGGPTMIAELANRRLAIHDQRCTAGSGEGAEAGCYCDELIDFESRAHDWFESLSSPRCCR